MVVLVILFQNMMSIMVYFQYEINKSILSLSKCCTYCMLMLNFISVKFIYSYIYSLRTSSIIRFYIIYVSHMIPEQGVATSKN